MTTEINTTTGIRHDLFAAIRYEKRHDKRGTVTGLQLDRLFALKWIFEEAWKYMSAGIVTADRGKRHTSESLFNDPAVWDGYDEAKKKGIHIALGRCLAYFVSHKMLPLERVNPDQNNALYRFIGQ